MEGRKEMEAAFEAKLQGLFNGVVLPLEQKTRMLENIRAMIAIASANKNLPEVLDLDEPAKSG